MKCVEHFILYFRLETLGFHTHKKNNNKQSKPTSIHTGNFHGSQQMFHVQSDYPGIDLTGVQIFAHVPGMPEGQNPLHRLAREGNIVPWETE